MRGCITDAGNGRRFLKEMQEQLKRMYKIENPRQTTAIYPPKAGCSLKPPKVTKILKIKKNIADCFIQQLTLDKQFLADSLADISHQLKTPLTALNLLTERMRGCITDAGNGTRFLKELPIAAFFPR